MLDKLKKNLKVKSKAMSNVGKEKISDKFSDLKKKSQELYQEYKEEEKKIRGEVNTEKVNNEEKKIIVAYYNDNGTFVKSSLKKVDKFTPRELLHLKTIEIEGKKYDYLPKKF